MTEKDTLTEWLFYRFVGRPYGLEWEGLDEDDKLYWEHEAAAVRRAVARGGFKEPK
ncbi:hypothetical protein AB0D68_10975 [Streptomyces sp. NPDC048212]|uniref:hypothetical protein n=1 Tax=Streptomyces sp. NPDC048212 TaxID=3156658 RepID=UPI0033D5494E